MPEQGQQQPQPARQRTLKLALALGLTAVLAVVVLIVVSQSGDKGGDTDIEVTSLPELEGLEQSGDTVGDPNAPVTIVEYADPQCPACKQFSQTVVNDLLAGPVAAGEANLQFRNWTILGPDSVEASKAVLAAGEQDKMWTYVKLFYDNQGPENSGYVNDEFLTALAEQSGLDVDQWESDREDPGWDAELDQIDADAVALGFDGTPSISLIGPGGEEPFRGTPSAEAISTRVKQLGG